MSQTIKYQDIIDDFLSGTHYGVFIDDTGSPGGASFKYLPSGRKTWVAVVIPPDKIRSTFLEFSSLLSELKTKFNISEFHFSDIFGGSREFRKISWDNRLGIINTLSQAFAELKYTIIHQSLDPSELPEWKKALDLPPKLSVFNFKKVEDTALFILIQKIKLHIRSQQNHQLSKAHVIIDEGWKKNGVGLISEVLFGNEFDSSKVVFGSSHEIVLLQLADFAGFVLNRMQIAGSKEQISKKESHFLQVVKPMIGLYNDVTHKQFLLHNKTEKIQQVH